MITPLFSLPLVGVQAEICPQSLVSPGGLCYNMYQKRNTGQAAGGNAGCDMVLLICCTVAFAACLLGTICGMGGGIIIKPVLDALGVMPVPAITFLSGCTVISMSCWSVSKTLLRREAAIDLSTTAVLAAGAAAGGLIGKQLYSGVAACFPDPNTAGGVQAGLLLAATAATLLYTVNKDKLASRQISSPAVCLIIGLLLGMLGSFLGIGGGPFNVAVLYYFFSMPAKKAAQNSLFIVLFSQLTSTLKTVLFDTIPVFSIPILLSMVLLSIAGSEAGRSINKKIDNRQATLWLEGAMVLVMGISIYNMVKFLGA